MIIYINTQIELQKSLYIYSWNNSNGFFYRDWFFTLHKIVRSC